MCVPHFDYIRKTDSQEMTVYTHHLCTFMKLHVCMYMLALFCVHLHYKVCVCVCNYVFFLFFLQNNALPQHIKIHCSRDTIFEDSFAQVKTNK